MNLFRFCALSAGLVFLGGCSMLNSKSTTSSARQNVILGESVILIGEQPAQLAFAPLRQKTIDVRSTYRNDLPKTVHYEAGRDFELDCQTGQIRRTPQSRMPDFRTNMLFGVEDFDHGKFPGFGNNGFFAFVDYAPKQKISWPQQSSQVEFLPKTKQKLASGQSLKIIAYGDSITAGGDATEPALIFWQRWAESLRTKYPTTKVEAVNGATGGDATPQGLARLQDKVLSQHPDLVLIGFGMNDHNVAGFGTPLDQFATNLGTMIDRIRKETGAEIILYSTFPPNPKWHYGSHKMEVYAAATEKVAREKQCAFADVYHNWLTFSSKKKPEDMLSNNINHPNDFGHSIYLQTFEKLDL